mgnify:FL=1
MSKLSKALRKVAAVFSDSERLVQAAKQGSLATHRRLRGMERVARTAADRRLPGGFVECGVFKGGSAAVVSSRLWRVDPTKDVHLFDVFTGMPKPGENDPKEAWDDVGKFVSSPDLVRQTFTSCGLKTDRLHIHQGLFENTLPKFTPSPLCFLHVDCDWYEPVKMVLEKFYDHVVPGGTIVLDDYGHWSGCRKAFDEFAAARGIKVVLTPIDYTSHYFLKP